MCPRVSIAVEGSIWWCVAVGVWIASLSAWSTQDFVVAAGCALPCAAAAVAARRAVRGAWRPRLRALRWVAVLPWSMATGAVAVLTLPFRSGRGVGFREVVLDDDHALAIAVLSSTPGTYVTSFDPESGTALVHAAGTRASAVERACTR
jgi:multisubunit Na+/H+ antiporter MnhE subunit